MATHIRRQSNFILPNISVVDHYADDILVAYELTPAEGYVMQHIGDNIMSVNKPDSVDLERKKEYYKFCSICVGVPVEEWGWEAVEQTDISSEQIF